MRKIKYFLVCSSILLLIGTSCNNKDATIEVVSQVVSPEVQYVDFQVDKEVELGPYEPMSGVYLGSYVEQNTTLDGDIEKYEALIGQEQAFRVFQYIKPGDIGQVELLECIANKQTPYIKLLPDTHFDLIPVYQLVGDLNTSYDVPIFIELLPVTGSMQDPEAYKSYYEEAYKVIKEELPYAVIVWAIDLSRAEEAELYYPGDYLVDWVGLNIYIPKYQEGEVYALDSEEKIDLIYKSFQQRKPMMISTLAISHFSRIDHTYTINDAKNKLQFFYSEVLEKYPRIKGILYTDIDMKQIRTDGLDDYRLTSHEELISTINQLQSSNKFLHQLIYDTVEKGSQRLTYTFPVIWHGEAYYIKEDYIENITQSFLFTDVDVISDEYNNKYYEIEPLINK